jgi:hypothetical protein
VHFFSAPSDDAWRAVLLVACRGAPNADKMSVSQLQSFINGCMVKQHKKGIADRSKQDTQWVVVSRTAQPCRATPCSTLSAQICD